MKKIILVLAALSLSFQTNSAPALSSIKNSYMYSLTAANITSYLQGQGYTVFSVWRIEDSTDWMAYTSKNGVNYQTHVTATATYIVTHEDSPL